MKTTNANPHRPFKGSRVAVFVCWLACFWAGTATPDAIAAGAEADENRTAAEDGGDPLPHGAVARMGSCRFACLGEISDLLFTPDGNRIVIVERRRITVREVATGEFVCRIQASGDDEFYCVAVARDGKRLLTYNLNSIGSKGLIQYWPLSANPRPSRTVRLESQSDGGLLGRHCLSGDAHRAVLWFQPTGGSIGKIRILDLASGEILFEHSPRVFCNAAISTDGKTLWTLNGKFRAWNIDSKSLQTDAHITGRVRLNFDHATVAPGGKTIVTIPVEPWVSAGDPQPAAVLWDATTGRVIHRLMCPAGTGVFADRAISPDGKTVAAAGRDTVAFWDVASGKPIRQIVVDESDLRKIAFSPDGRTLATAGADRIMSGTPGRDWRVRLWEVATGRELHSQPGHRSFIQSLAVFPNGKTVASACWSGGWDKPSTIRIWDRATGKQVRTMEVPEFTGAPMATSRRGDMLAIGQNRGTILLLNPSDGKPTGQLQGHFERPNCLAFSADGQLLVSASGSVGVDDRVGPEDNSLRIWDVTTAKQLFKSERPGGTGVVSLALTPDGKIFATASSQQTRLWSLAERKTLATLARGAHALDFSPDGKILAAAAGFPSSVGQSIWIGFYDTATGHKLREWTLPNGPVCAVKFVDGGRLLAFSDGVGSIYLRDMATGKPRAQLTDRLHGHRAAVASLALTPDGRFLVSASRDSTLLAWDVRTLLKSTGTDTSDDREIRPTVTMQPTAAEVQNNTPENRKAVGDGPEAPFSEPPPVPVEPEAPTKSDARAQQLKAEAKEFWLLLQHKAYETDPQRSVMLSGPNGPEPLFDRWREPYATHAEISADAAQKLIDHLQADGFLAGASDVNENAKVFSGWPNYTLTVGAAGGSGYRADLGWDEKTVSRIDALAKVLGEDSPKAVAALKAISTSVKQHLAEAAKRKDHVPEALAGSLDRFALYLRFTPGQSGKYKNLVLSVPDFDRTWDPNYWLSARIAKDDALRITQHLATKGFFARCGTVRPKEQRILPSPRGPAYTLTIASARWGFSVENLGCDREALRRLSALRAELRGDAAKAMDVVVSLAARRLAVRQADLEDFSLVVRIADQGKIQSAVLLSTGNTPWKSQGRVQTPPDNQVRIGKEMAAKIIEHLLKEGVPERAKNVQQMGTMSRNLQYILTVNEHSQDGFGEYVPLDLGTLERLDTLRKNLNGDAAKAMDKLLAGLEPYRTAWKKAPADPDAVKARAAEVEKQIQTYYRALRGGEKPARQTWWEGNKEIMPLLVPHLLASSDVDVQHTALLIVRNHCGRRDFVPHIIGALDSLINRPKEAMDHAGSTRRLACDLLAKWPDLRSVPVLLKALGDPYMRHDLVGGPDGHVEHSYSAVWWEADSALRLITWANPIDEPRRGLGEGDDQDRTRAAWEKWWRANGDRWLKSPTPPWEKGDRTELEWQLARLRQVQPRIRAEAAMALAQLGGDRAVRALIEARTVGPLVRVGPPAVVPLLETLKDSRPAVRRYAANVLGELRDPRALDPLAAAMNDTEEDVREEAAFALTKLGPEGADRLLAALGGDSPQVRKEAAATLHVLKDPDTVDPLIAAMQDKDSGVRYAAAYSLLRMGDKRAIEPFIAAIGDSEVWVRRYTTEGLATFGDARAVEPLIAALGDEDQKVRIKAAEGLGRLRDRRAGDALIRALQDPDNQIRSAAATALGTLEEPRALEPLVTALKDRSPSVRCASVAALGKLGDPRAVKPLTALLQDEHDYIRRAAAAALKQVANPKPTPERTTQPPEPAPPELNVVTHFRLILRFNPAHGTRPDKFPTIEFSTEPMLPKPYPPGYWFVRITPPQATKLYDHLKQTGFFNRRERDPKKETKPSYSMRSSGPLGSHFEYLGWGPPLIKRLTGLREVLDEETAKPVDQLLGALSKADADALLAKVRDVLPEGWEATLYWNPEDPEFTPLRVGSLDEKWRSWLPGMDGRRIEIRRKKAVHFDEDFAGPGPGGDYCVREKTEYLRFALTLAPNGIIANWPSH